MKGKTILITGGSRGIGQAISSKSAAEDANVVVIAKKEPPANHLASTAQRIEATGGKILAIDADLSEANTVLMKNYFVKAESKISLIYKER